MIPQPASPTSVRGKVRDQILLKPFTNMKDKMVIRSSQHGFTKRKTCLTNLIALYDEIIGLVDEEKAVKVLILILPRVST